MFSWNFIGKLDRIVVYPLSLASSGNERFYARSVPGAWRLVASDGQRHSSHELWKPCPPVNKEVQKGGDAYVSMHRATEYLPGRSSSTLLYLPVPTRHLSSAY